jgi:hypothetical protein
VLTLSLSSHPLFFISQTSTPFLSSVVAAASLLFLPAVTAQELCFSTSEACKPNGFTIGSADWSGLVSTNKGNTVSVPKTWPAVNIDFNLCSGCALFTNQLYVFIDGLTSTDFVFNNKASLDTIVSKTCIVPATDGELKLSMFVADTGETWYSGPAARNWDNFAHGSVVPQADIESCATFFVAFEDLVDGGDQSFGDLSFSMTVCPDVTPPSIECIPVADPVAVGTTIGQGSVVVSTSDNCDVNPTVTLSQTTFSASGLYPVTATATDASGNAASCTSQVPVYDPAAGFVTGGGWITSPAGAYKRDLTATGKASYGFVSKYEKGATVSQYRLMFCACSMLFLTKSGIASRPHRSPPATPSSPSWPGT